MGMHDPVFVLAQDGRSAKLHEDWYVRAHGLAFCVRRGFVTDWASVPRFLWWWIPPMGQWSLAALAHDYLYRSHLTSRRNADAVFYALMRDAGVWWLRARLMWLAVRLFGGPAYRAGPRDR